MSAFSKWLKKAAGVPEIRLDEYIQIKPQTVAVTKALFFRKCEDLGVNKSTAVLLWAVLAGAFKADG